MAISSVSSNPVTPPAQQPVNQANGNFETAVQGDKDWGCRGGLGGEVGVDQFVDQKKASGGVILNPDDLF